LQPLKQKEFTDASWADKGKWQEKRLRKVQFISWNIKKSFYLCTPAQTETLKETNNTEF